MVRLPKNGVVQGNYGKKWGLLQPIYAFKDACLFNFSKMKQTQIKDGTNGERGPFFSSPYRGQHLFL